MAHRLVTSVFSVKQEVESAPGSELAEKQGKYGKLGRGCVQSGREG